MKQSIDLGGMRLAPYSPCIVVGDQIWVAGQIGTDGGESLREQAKRALDKIEGLLVQAGSSKSDLVKVTVLLIDMKDFSDFNEIYGEWLEGTVLPARAAFAVKELPGQAKVEVVAEAVLGSGGI
ncbi:MAG: RidA family protein [Candidatus Thermoplasmatota archaeon]|nr:RidA family protein [Candidatus Thalassarchaeaceae archaeon]MEC7664761.1 RidA family protein [Candidatus Thermoplasmatota archaeon]MEC8044759.1 RidA family protein [Candidatus Thermoplasmatota archaeon]MEC9137032.1 RidA family protein [Candidatus Thermoplasmatota archaeon]MED5303644.1 RidA family protein [Candidatus Thermoplasmatota archaeon]